jgi:drug/metabolite transporter (DMT)-like permease
MTETRSKAVAIGPRLGVVLLLLIATVFGSNHVAARVAFEHGASVTTAVVVRATCTAIFVLVLARLQGVRLALPRPRLARAIGVGAMLAVQSYCLYAAVARIPVALALLAFYTFPMLLALLSFATGGERPGRRTLVAMPIALAGLALALDVFGQSAGVAARWAEIGAGVGFALGAAVAFALVLLFTTRWLKDVDGRVRTFYTTGVAAVLVTLAGASAGSLALPQGTQGWVGLAALTVFYGSAITALFVLLPRLGAVNNSVVLSFEPIAVLFLAWVILGQTVTPLQIVGAFVVIGAIAFLGTARR